MFQHAHSWCWELYQLFLSFMICFAFLLKLFLSIMARFTQSPNRGSPQTFQYNRTELHLFQNSSDFHRDTSSLSLHNTAVSQVDQTKKEKKNNPSPLKQQQQTFSEVPWPQIVYRLRILSPTALIKNLLPKGLLDPAALLPADRKQDPGKSFIFSATSKMYR